MKIKDMPSAVGNIDIDRTDVKTAFVVLGHFIAWGIGAIVGLGVILLMIGLMIKLPL